MTLNQLLYFQKVAENQHFRQAAADLNISQPSLSRSVAGLEEELGIVLFERVGRNVCLTKYGKVFLEHTGRILDEVKLAGDHMRRLAGDQGHVDIAYVFPLAESYIPHMVRRFLKTGQNSGITFSFHQSHTSDMVAGLKADRYDVIFGSYAEDEPDIQFVPIINQKLVVIAPFGHPLTRRSSVLLKDLERYPLIGYDHSSGLGKFTRRIYQSHGLSPEIICESPDENAISALVAEDFGIALVAEDFGIALVADVDLIRGRRVCVLPLEDADYSHTVYMAYKKDHYLVQAVKNFIRFIRKEGTHL